jgi:hypothetical protein
VGGLGHYLESEGLPTAGLSLLRDHSVKLRPPRALWVPFDFGHPFGVAHDAALQSAVLRAALGLFERESGPVLEDFAGDPKSAAEHPDGSAAPWSCPIPSRKASPAPDESEQQRLEREVEEELHGLLPWYEEAVASRGRTAVGASGLGIDRLLPYIGSFFDPALPESPIDELSPVMALKIVTDDLKQLYLEAVSAQPGDPKPTHSQLNDWLWRETKLSELFRKLRERLADLDDPAVGMIAQFLIVPHAQHA